MKRAAKRKKSKYKPLDIDTLGNHLLGSASSLDAALKEYGRADLTDAEQDQLDNITVLCDGCGWWVEPEEITANNVCEQCDEDGVQV